MVALSAMVTFDVLSPPEWPFRDQRIATRTRPNPLGTDAEQIELAIDEVEPGVHRPLLESPLLGQGVVVHSSVIAHRVLEDAQKFNFLPKKSRSCLKTLRLAQKEAKTAFLPKKSGACPKTLQPAQKVRALPNNAFLPGN